MRGIALFCQAGGWRTPFPKEMLFVSWFAALPQTTIQKIGLGRSPIGVNVSTNRFAKRGVGA